MSSNLRRDHKEYQKHNFSIVILLLAFSCVSILSFKANSKALKIFTYKTASGGMSFSDKEPFGVAFSYYRADCYACQPDSLLNWRKVKLYFHPYKQTINDAAANHGIDPAFVRAVIHAESHFNPKAISKQGAQGLMQLMPATAKSLGVKNAFAAAENIQGGVKHLARLLKKYRGDMKLASAAYNAGEGAVKKYGGIPPFKETEVYVERVNILQQRYDRFAHLSK
jgi:soluble lytic murein transglycosylase-like protein